MPPSGFVNGEPRERPDGVVNACVSNRVRNTSTRIKYCIKEDIPLNEFDTARIRLEPSSKRSNAMEYQSNGFHYVPGGS